MIIFKGWYVVCLNVLTVCNSIKILTFSNFLYYKKIIDRLESPSVSVSKRTRDQRSKIRDGYSGRQSKKRVREAI